ncbi:MAG: LysM peptidoglycan-binding domain-containing protein [Anaerolineales bacterium]|nr:LysM peptidoglycan-binding domain-containing protein [Anaerolineales bacterium]
MRKQSTALLFLILCGLLLAGAVGPVQAQNPDGAEYTVQAGDWLSKIAEKYFGDAGAYPTIIEATNTKAGQDTSFAAINDPNLIDVGQKLWIPGLQGENTITAGALSFQPVEIEALGLRVLVPQNWPEVDSTDPLFAHAWSAGLFSVVNFTTLPGNDPLVGVARSLGVPPEALSGASLGGQLITDQMGGRPWVIYTRDEGGRAAITAATAEQKVIYQISIFSESSQAETIVRTVLENFEIVDPLAAQQVITISHRWRALP